MATATFENSVSSVSGSPPPSSSPSSTNSLSPNNQDVKVSLLSQKAIIDATTFERNGLEGMERRWTLIDWWGTVRNMLAAAWYVTESAFIAGGIALFQTAGGLLILHSATFETIPDALAGLSKAETKEDKIHGYLGLVDQSLFGGIGLTFLGLGTTTVLSPDVAHFVGYTPLIGSEIAVNILTQLLGYICVVRGTAIGLNSLYALHYLNKFQNEFRSSEDRKNFLLDALKDECAFKRRVGAKALEKVKEWAKTETKPSQDLLLIVDIGIHKQKFKQALLLIIAILMVTASIAFLIASNGIGVLVLGVIASILFSKMEALFLFFDSSKFFNWLTDRFYTPPPFLEKTFHSVFSSTPSIDVQ